MKNLKWSVLLIFVLMLCTFCGTNNEYQKENLVDTNIVKSANEDSVLLIDQNAALQIAHKNAITAYRDLSIYTISSELKEDKWYVDYNLTDTQMLGGGPHYVISAVTGEILVCRYEQ